MQALGKLRQPTLRGRIVLLAVLSLSGTVALACIIATITFQRAADLSSDGFLSAVAATALLAALPVVLALAWVIFRVEEQKRGLAAREEMFTTAQHIGKLGYWHYDIASGRFVLSDNLHELLGDPELTLSMTLQDLIERTNPADRGLLGSALARIVVNRTCEQSEYRVTGLDGVERTFWFDGRPMFDPSGKAVRAYGACQDITERKQIEAALRESEDHYRHAVELNPQIPWTADPEGNILEIGPVWLEYTGMARIEALGMGWADALHPEDTEPTLRAWSDMLISGAQLNLEHRLRHSDGSYRWFRARAAARRTDAGEIVRWYGTLEDVHERKTIDAALRDSESFTRSILNSSPDCIKVIDLDGSLRFMNDPGLACMEISDFAPLKGTSCVSLWPEAARADLTGALDAAREGRTGRFFGFRPTAKGTPKWWDVSVSPILGPDGKPDRLLAISRDMSAEKRTQDDLLQARAAAEDAAQRLANVLSSTSDCVITLDRDQRFTFLNRQAEEFMAEGRNILGMTYAEAFSDIGEVPHKEYYEEAIATQTPVHFEGYFASHDVWLDVHIYPSDEGTSIFMKDVSDQHRAQQQLLYLAQHDPLTGLVNRTVLHEQLDRALTASTPDMQTVVLFLDLDEFKAVNDTLGHEGGDRVLIQVAERLQSCVRSADTVARFGGDEFAIVASVRDAMEASALADRIVANMRLPFALDDRIANTGVSIGLIMVSAPGSRAEDILRDADVALYRAKAEGRDTYRVFETGMGDIIQERQQLKHDLRNALQRGEFAIEYQPLNHFETRRINGFEALLRWHHPAKGLVPPSTFIPIAEEAGFIVDIGEWVLARTCEQAASWPDGLSVAVNLSPVQFRSGNLIATVERCLSNAGLPAARLQLEITESVLLVGNEVNLEALHALRRLGVSIFMDDFGTGYSSLSYLRSFPFDKIKIDRSFVSDLSDDDARSGKPNPIVRSIIDLARSLGTKTTAEGVETDAHARTLAEMGCNEGQGFLFSRPISPEHIPELISRFNSSRRNPKAHLRMIA